MSLPPNSIVKIIGDRLPDKMAEAFESFKIEIMRHRIDGWREVSRSEALNAVAMLAEMVMRPVMRGTHDTDDR